MFLDKHIKTKSVDRIVGGQEVSINDFGWQVALEQNGQLFCGGSIISEQWILSSAQCFDR